VRRCVECGVEGSRLGGGPGAWGEVVQKDCQVRGLNGEYGVDRGRWRGLIEIG